MLRGALFLVLAVLGAGCNENLRTSYYPLYRDALGDGAKMRGWIPDIVPASATEIHEQHSTQTNSVWIRFRIPETERTMLREKLHKLTADEVRAADPVRPKDVDWWFSGIAEDAAGSSGLHADVYCAGSQIPDARCSVFDGVIAFDRESQLVYYWKCE